MATEITTTSNEVMTTKSLFSSDNVKKKFQELLNQKAQGFITSVLQAVASNDLLQKASPQSVYHAAITAATMDLPINQNLGFAYIVPYKGQAQFQMGWRGFVQLAQRTGSFKTINTIEVYENQLDHFDILSGEITLKNIEPSGKVVGYVAYFKLINGFEKSLYMSRDQMSVHAKKYSQSFKKGYGVWADGEDGFNAMGKKTVLKLLLSKYAPLSIEIQKAITLDQAVVNNEEGTEFSYVDNSQDVINKETERQALLAIDALIECKDIQSVIALRDSLGDDVKEFSIEGKLVIEMVIEKLESIENTTAK